MVEILLIIISVIVLLPLLPFLFTAIGYLILAVPAVLVVGYLGAKILHTDGGWMLVPAIAMIVAVPFAAIKIADAIAGAWGRRQRLFRRRPTL